MKQLLLLILIPWSISPSTSMASEGPANVAVGELAWNAPREDFIRFWGNADYAAMTRALNTMVTTALSGTRRFNVLERNQVSQLINEIDFVNEQGLVDPSDLENNPRWGFLKGVKYLVLGAITEFSIGKSAIGLNGEGGSRSAISMTVDLRVVDVESGRILSAKPLHMQYNEGISISLGGNSFGKSRNRGEIRGKVMRQIANKLVHRLVSDISPITVLNVRGGDVILSYGAGLLSPGDELNVYRLGEAYEIPGLGLSEREMIDVGKVEVYQVQGMISKARPMKKTKAKNINAGSLCRMADGESTLSKGDKLKKKLMFWKK